MPEVLKVLRVDDHAVFGACVFVEALVDDAETVRSAYAAEQGFARLRTNRRIRNLGASRYWPARGFELTHIRLVRRVPDL